ncbi:MAG: hypothetical protein KDD75_03650, partial [Caldilineaceae bacterium]|nr:hypothetical protein [Caldilinea sp.]MCB0134184.1 hypothetical protein [Caldilineaceae bacterium]
DDSVLLMDVLLSPLIDAGGDVTGFLFVGRDVTEARALAAEVRSLNASLEQRVAERTADLSAALDQLQQADRMKDEFLAAISHELRTPLSTVLGAADVLAMEVHGSLGDYQKRLVQTINAGGERLLTMVNNLLRYARLIAGKTTLLNERCAMHEIAEAAVQRASFGVAAKQITMSYAVTPPGLTIISDAEAIMTMLDALLDNAAKFTPNGGTITLTIAGAGDEMVHLVVADDGVGMALEKQSQVFRPFV